ncbi:MAG: FAD:protein FMN transferase [Geminicoccaceae bacterium]
MLQIAAGLSVLGVSSAAPRVPQWRWQGSALGAVASLDLRHTDRARATRLVQAAVTEIARLEAIFSLQRTDSALSRLNRDGRLDHPPLELVAVLDTAAMLSKLSGGAFDVTVQPLWRLHAGAAVQGARPSDRLIERTLARVGWQSVDACSRLITFERPGMAVTLNGIAQGYITDRVTELLRDAGLDDLFVNLGEQRALTGRPAGRPWRVATPAGTVALADRALAVSEAQGSDGLPNLISPVSGRPVPEVRQVVVTAPSAQLADAASTALAVSGPRDARELSERLSSLGVAVVESIARDA